MKESDFLINALKGWCERFEGIHVCYAYDAVLEYHIVEVDPESVRRGNEEYKKAELALWTSFMKEFPESDLLISEPSSANDMANCLFESTNSVPKLSGWETIWTLNDIFVESVTTLTKKSARHQSNEYENKSEYALAA